MTDLFTVKTDRASDSIIEYIRYFCSENYVKRILGDSYSYINIEINNCKHNISLGKINEGNINVNHRSAFLRRGLLSFDVPFKINMYNENITKHISKEFTFLRDFVYSYALKLGSMHKEIHNNKLSNLLLARDCGIKVPPTLITTSKLELEKFYQKHTKILTKPIHNGHLYFEEEQFVYSCKGILFLGKEEMKEIGDEFCVSLFQAYTEKELELRIFFLDKEIYPMAIFSQLDEKTKYDFRNYNHIKPNRNVPFKLPQSFKKKLEKFIDEIDLNTGSIDVILTPENEFYFLEVNPTGQFGWVSQNCNFYLEKEIAKYLIDYEV